MVEKEENKRLGMKVTFRVLQAISWGVCSLGLSMGIGDYTTFIALPIKSISITLTIFGFVAAMITGYQAKNCEKW